MSSGGNWSGWSDLPDGPSLPRQRLAQAELYPARQAVCASLSIGSDASATEGRYAMSDGKDHEDWHVTLAWAIIAAILIALIVGLPSFSP